MKVLTTLICQWALVATVVIVRSPAFALPSAAYRVTDLGTLGGTASYANGINNLGQVVGYSYTTGTEATTGRAFRTGPNATINPATDNLGTLGGFFSVGNAINDLGQVVGGSYLANSNSHAFRTKPNSPIDPTTDDLGTLGGRDSAAWAINESGQVAGDAFVSGFSMLRAFRTGPNAAINPATDNLGTFGGRESAAYGMNNSGQVVGYSFIPGNSITHAFRTSGPGPMNAATDDIGIAIGNHSGGYAINDSGQATGVAYFSGTVIGNAFRTAPNAAINPATDNLGTLPGTIVSTPRAINSAGWVVGFASNQTQVVHRAFLYDGTTIMGLNDVLDETGTGWILQIANDINDRNQIVGHGTHNGVTRAFRLDPIPIPEPSALALTVVAAFAMIACSFHAKPRPAAT